MVSSRSFKSGPASTSARADAELVNRGPERFTSDAARRLASECPARRAGRRRESRSASPARVIACQAHDHAPRQRIGMNAATLTGHRPTGVLLVACAVPGSRWQPPDPGRRARSRVPGRLSGNPARSRCLVCDTAGRVSVVSSRQGFRVTVVIALAVGLGGCLAVWQEAGHG